jgi:E3 ubiquitin-protein ligase NEDD4
MRPGQPFALIVNDQKIIVECPLRKGPGEKITFKMPVLVPDSVVRAVCLRYEKGGWSRCLTSDLQFVWTHQAATTGPAAEAAGEAKAAKTGGPPTRQQIDALAFVRQLTRDPIASRGYTLKLVPALESTASTLMNGRTLAFELAKRVRDPFQTKEAWFRGEIQKLQVPWEEGHVRIVVRRASLLDDAMAAFESVRRENLRKTFRFEFSGEPGIDAGGVSRELYQLVSSELFHPDRGLFQASAINQSCCQINPASGLLNKDHLRYFHFCGRLFAKALFDRQIVNAHFVQSLYKHLLGWPVVMDDLEALDNDVHSNLLKLLDLDDVSMLELDFTCSVSVLGKAVEEELKPGGTTATVTNETLEEYLSLQCTHRVLTRVKEQVKALVTGFYDVIDAPLLTVFDFQELELLLCGLPEINLADWQANTEYLGEYQVDGSKHPVVKMFWDVMENELSEEQRARFLQFATGTSGVPATGFAYLQGNDSNVRRFAITSITKAQSIFPRAHTCFNRVDLPLYDSKEELSKFLTMAVQMQSVGFDVE